MKTVDDLKKILLSRDTTLPQTISERMVFIAIQGKNPPIGLETTEILKMKSLISCFNAANQEYHQRVDAFDKMLNSPKLKENDLLPLMEQWGVIDEQLEAAKLAHKEIAAFIQQIKKRIADLLPSLNKPLSPPLIKKKSFLWLRKLIAYYKVSFIQILFDDPDFFIRREQLNGMPATEASSERQLIAFIKHVIGYQEKFPAAMVTDILNIVHSQGGVLCFDLAFNTNPEKRFGLIAPEAKLLLEDLDTFIEKYITFHSKQKKLLYFCMKINRSLANALTVAIQSKDFSIIIKKLETWASIISNIFKVEIPKIQKIQIHLKFASESLKKIKAISEFLIKEHAEGRSPVIEDSLIKTLAEFQNFNDRVKGPVSDILREDYLKIMDQKKLRESTSENNSFTKQEVTNAPIGEIAMPLSTAQRLEELESSPRKIIIQYESHKKNGISDPDSNNILPDIVGLQNAKVAVQKAISV